MKLPSELPAIAIDTACREVHLMKRSGDIAHPPIAANEVEWVWAIIRPYLEKEIGTAEEKPVPMLLWCPSCKGRHIDIGEFADKAHHTHACQHCGMVWRPAIGATVGVQFLPGFQDR